MSINTSDIELFIWGKPNGKLITYPENLTIEESLKHYARSSEDQDIKCKCSINKGYTVIIYCEYGVGIENANEISDKSFGLFLSIKGHKLNALGLKKVAQYFREYIDNGLSKYGRIVNRIGDRLVFETDSFIQNSVKLDKLIDLFIKNFLQEFSYSFVNIKDNETDSIRLSVKTKDKQAPKKNQIPSGQSLQETTEDSDTYKKGLYLKIFLAVIAILLITFVLHEFGQDFLCLIPDEFLNYTVTISLILTIILLFVTLSKLSIFKGKIEKKFVISYTIIAIFGIIWGVYSGKILSDPSQFGGMVKRSVCKSELQIPIEIEGTNVTNILCVDISKSLPFQKLRSSEIPKWFEPNTLQKIYSRLNIEEKNKDRLIAKATTKSNVTGLDLIKVEILNCISFIPEKDKIKLVQFGNNAISIELDHRSDLIHAVQNLPTDHNETDFVALFKKINSMINEEINIKPRDQFDTTLTNIAIFSDFYHDRKYDGLAEQLKIQMNELIKVQLGINLFQAGVSLNTVKNTDTKFYILDFMSKLSEENGVEIHLNNWNELQYITPTPISLKEKLEFNYSSLNYDEPTNRIRLSFDDYKAFEQKNIEFEIQPIDSKEFHHHGKFSFRKAYTEKQLKNAEWRNFTTDFNKISFKVGEIIDLRYKGEIRGLQQIPFTIKISNHPISLKSGIVFYESISKFISYLLIFSILSILALLLNYAYGFFLLITNR